MNQKEAYNRYVGNIEWHNIKVKEMNKEGTNWFNDKPEIILSFKDWKKYILPENIKNSREMAKILSDPNLW